jgi:hypothetical protein
MTPYKSALLWAFEDTVEEQQKIIVQEGKDAEEVQGPLETKAYPFQTPVKNRPGRASSPFSKHFKEIAAPEAYSGIEAGTVPGNPPLFPVDPLTHQKKGRRGLSDGFHKDRFLLAFKSAAAAHDPELGKGLADIFLCFLENPGLRPQ